MSPLVVIGLVAGFIAIMAGLQSVFRQLQLYPVNPGSAGSIVATDRTRTFATHTFELEELRAIVADSMSSTTTANAKLWPLIDELKAVAPDPSGPSRQRDSAARRSIGTKRRQTSRLEQALAELEEAWDQPPLDEPHDR